MAHPRRGPRRAPRRGSLTPPRRRTSRARPVPAAPSARGYRRCGLALRARPPRRQPRGTTTSSGCAFTRYRPLTDNPVLRRLLESGQYVSLAFGQAARDAGIARSMGSKGDCWDNAVAESLFATLKKELVPRRSWPTRRELTSEIFEYVEAFYNRTRRHSTLDYLSPADYQNRTLINRGASLAASRL